jgi:ketosteroid isomerase-like protein
MPSHRSAEALAPSRDIWRQRPGARSSEGRQYGYSLLVVPARWTMHLTNLEMVRTYWNASARSDYSSAGKCIAAGYVWIDHTAGVVARTVDELLAAAAEDAAWSDRTFDITNALETTDGALVVQATVSGTLNGTWRSVEAHGRRVSSDSCTIFRFDDDGRIRSEEHYSDALTIVEQLAANDPTR